MVFTASIYILLTIPALLIFWEDVKTRMVTIWKIILLVAVSLVLFTLLSRDLASQLVIVSYNLGIIAVFYLSLVLAYYLKEKKLNLSLAGKMGLADLLIVLPPALCFSNFLFLYFIIACVLTGLIYGTVLQIRKRNTQATVPLAGITAMLFCMSFILLSVFKIDFQSNSSLFDYFIL